MAYNAKVWVDRQTEFPTRRRLVNDDGVTPDQVVTVYREEGTIYNPGDAFDATNMNGLESRINAGFQEKQDILSAGNGIRIDGTVISATSEGGGVEFINEGSGSVVSFNNGADNLPAIEITAGIEAQQAGDPTPTSEVTVTGFTGLNLTRAGKNLYGGNKLATDMDAVFDSGYSRTGNIAVFDASATVNESLGILPYSANTSYTIILSVSKSNTNKATNLRVYYTDGSNTNIQIPETTITAGTKYTFAFVTSSARTLKSIRKYTGSGTTTLYIDEFGIFEGTLTAQEFEPYAATIFPVSWQTEAGTIYGGRVNIITGELTQTWKEAVYTGDPTESWNMDTSGGFNRFFTSISDAKAGDGTRVRVLSNRGKFNAAALDDALGTIFILSASGNAILYYIPDQSCTDVESFKAWLSTHNLKVYYELDPSDYETYQIDPVLVATLLGENSFFENAGNIEEMKYYTTSASDVLNFMIKDSATATDSTWSSSKIAAELLGKQAALTAGDNITIDANNEISAQVWKDLTGRLTIGSTSLTISDEAITTSSTIEVFTEIYGVNPNTISVETGSITMTFTALDQEMRVKVRVS